MFLFTIIKEVISLHVFDSSPFKIHTDLIEDVVKEEKGKYQEEERTFLGGKVKRLVLTEKDQLSLGKKKGNYSTIFFDDITDVELREALSRSLQQEISYFLEKFSLHEDASFLLIGLGNRSSTPDSLGPKSLSYVTITRHLYMLGLDVAANYRSVASITPGVMAQTGMETQEYILSLIHQIKPSCVIAIDALASSSIERIMKTIQLTDTGIHPGSGIGNMRKEISKDTIGIPVLAIGVPTVVGASTIVQNTLTYLSKKISYQKEKSTSSTTKFLTGLENAYKNQKDTLTKQEKKELLGEVGNLTDKDQMRLFEEVLTPLGYNFIVTPAEVDESILHLSKIIGIALDKTLHHKKEENPSFDSI